jgi:hypothetical protein
MDKHFPLLLAMPIPPTLASGPAKLGMVGKFVAFKLSTEKSTRKTQLLTMMNSLHCRSSPSPWVNISPLVPIPSGLDRPCFDALARKNRKFYPWKFCED